MNLAMLAKQGWRVVTRQASLLFKVLKGKYFRRSSFIHAKLRAHPSFGWRSLLEGRRVLLKGLCWQVGDGRRIDIWTEPWGKTPGEGSNRRGGQGAWGELWKLKVAPRVKLFLCKLIHNIQERNNGYGTRPHCHSELMEVHEDRSRSGGSPSHNSYGMNSLADFDKANQRDTEHLIHKEQPNTTNLQNQVWIPPLPNFIKVNSDAAWQSMTNEGATVRELRISCDVEVIIGDIIHLTNYMEVKFQYVKRLINNAAHVVADWDHRGALEEEWLSTPPVWLSPAL
ncbi:hypothetical protein LIER_26285 [Lithospermum erythrorhizon]|uniref:Uncharacterized protein n=1 Tax=Lithospermum erythrorhizon TaxID=34254 RepID=A0AAV3R7T6_LITER